MPHTPGSNKDHQNMVGNYQPMHILKWIICHTAICDDITTTNEDIRKAFVKQNPHYEQYRLSSSIGKLLKMAYFGKLQKRVINGKRVYNIQVFDDAIMDITITRREQQHGIL